MKSVVFLSFIISLQWSLQAQSHDDFYYGFDKKVYLDIVPGKYALEFPSSVDDNIFLEHSIEFEKIRSNLYKVNSNITTIQNVFNQGYYINPIYTLSGGAEIFLTRKIVIKFKEDVTEEEKINLENNFGLQLIESRSLFDIYSVNNALQISKEIFETGKAVYSYPDFMMDVQFHSLDYEPDDPYYNKQYSLHNEGQEINDGNSGTYDADIDAPEAWEYTLGSSEIIVAVIDDGVTSDHPDLPNTRQVRLEGSNFNENGDPNDPSPVIWYENHGNVCAGLIAASHNSEGIAGIAPECKIMPIREPYMAGSTVYSAMIDFAVQNGAKIISNSWGFEVDDPNTWPGVTNTIEDAINNGVIVLFSTGNLAHHSANEDAYVTYPGNVDVDGLITVGASDRNDQQSEYSPTDEEIDVTAPTSAVLSSQETIPDEFPDLWSMDTPGDYGTNPYYTGEILPSTGTNYLSYTGRSYGGTSSATAIVSGCVALALSVNPSLSVTQVNNLIKYNADKIQNDNVNYFWNPAMPGHSKEFGYGRLNCYKVVKTASDMYTANATDLYIRDQENDFGIEPNDTGENNMWSSPDIWVRNQDDGIENQEHQNPIFGQTNYVYVRVTNKGEFASTGNEKLSLHWAKAGTNLSWPEHWNGSIGPPLMGDLLGEKTIPVIQSGEENIVSFTWDNIPDPSLYGTDDAWHFCLLSRIVSPDNDPMAVAEGSSVYMNTFNNNNIAWKNVSIIGQGSLSRNPGATIAIGNTDYQTGGGGETHCYDIELKVPKPFGPPSILDVAEVTLTLDDIVYNSWVAGGKQGKNVKDIKNNQIRITGDNAFLQNLCFAPGESGTIFVGFNFLMSVSDYEKDLFKYQVTQMTTIDHEIIGGELYIIHKPSHSKFKANAGDDKNISKNESIFIDAESINEDAEYNWYDSKDSLVHTGTTMNVSLDTTTKYKLEVIADIDGYKDYDEVTIHVKQYEITSIVPNPTNGLVTINYDVENVSSAYILLSNPDNTSTETINLDLNQGSFTLDASNRQPGYYGLTLIVNDQIVDQKLLVVQ